MTPIEQEQLAIPSGEDDVSQYLREIRKYPRLTPEQERELARKCAEGDEDAIRAMVSANLRLVVSVAREYAGRGVPLLDLIQEGSIGLLVAAKKFDYTLDYRFSTYATKWIRQGVTRCILNAGLIRVPVHTGERIRKLLSARAALQQETGQNPTQAELALRCGISETEVRQLLELVPEVCSLDAPIGGGEDGTLQLLLEDIKTPQPQEKLVREELKNVVDQMLALLPERQQQVLRLYYGMEDGVCHSLRQIGQIMQITKERARQIKQSAMEKLHKLGAELGLEDFLA